MGKEEIEVEEEVEKEEKQQQEVEAVLEEEEDSDLWRFLLVWRINTGQVSVVRSHLRRPNHDAPAGVHGMEESPFRRPQRSRCFFFLL